MISPITSNLGAEARKRGKGKRTTNRFLAHPFQRMSGGAKSANALSKQQAITPWFMPKGVGFFIGATLRGVEHSGSGNRQASWQKQTLAGGVGPDRQAR